MPRPYVDHRPPRQTLLSALSSGRPCLVTVKADSGKGKTRLLAFFREECVRRDLTVAVMDFKQLQGLDAISMLASLRMALRDLKFPLYDAAIRSHQESPVLVLQDITMTNSRMGNIEASQRDQRLNRLSDRTEMFMADLQSDCIEKRTVLLLDSFEKTNDEVKAWITGQIIPQVHDIRNLLVVVAGQDKPFIDPMYWADMYRHLELPSKLLWEDWVEYAQEVGALSRLGIENLRRYYEHCDGDPSTMCIHCDPFLTETI